MSDTVQLLMQIQAHIRKYRRLASSGRFDHRTSSQISQLADAVEQRARELDLKEAG